MPNSSRITSFELLEARRVFDSGLIDLPVPVGQPPVTPHPTFYAPEGQPFYAAIEQTADGEVLQIAGALSSGACGVSFAEPFIDAQQRWALPVTFVYPDPSFMYSCDMKYYSHTAAVPEDFAGPIVVQATQQQRQLVEEGENPAGNVFELVTLDVRERVVRESAAPAPNSTLYPLRATIESTDAGEILMVSGAKSSISTGVDFGEGFVDDAGRWVLPMTTTGTGGGYAAVKYFEHRVALPANFVGAIVVQETTRRPALVDGHEIFSPIGISETIVREATAEQAQPPLDPALPDRPLPDKTDAIESPFDLASTDEVL